MAKRKLNKKVAISGIIVLAVLAVAAAGVMWQMRKDPHKLLGQVKEQLSAIETQLAQYRQMVKDPDTSQPNLEQKKEKLLEAGREAYVDVFGKYRRATGAAKDDALKIDILFELADLYLTNNEFHRPDWDKTLRTWYTITTIDPANLTARMKLLRYFYDTGNAGNPTAWSRVKEQVSGTEPDGSDGLIRIMIGQNKQPDPFVLKAKARAGLELAASGQVTDRVGNLDQAIADFETLLQQTPDDVESYSFLAGAVRLRGDIRSSAGQTGAAEEAARQAEDVLQKAVDTLPENVFAYINLLEMKLAATQRDSRQVQALEADFQAITDRFGSSAAAWASLSGYYQFSNQTDKAIDAITRAMELDSQNIHYAQTTANLYYLKSSLQGDTQFQKAIDIATAALAMPDAQAISGPRRSSNLISRLTLHSFLARMYVEQALQALQDDDRQKHRFLVAKIEESVHEITQIYGSSTNIYAIMWAGILDLARGQNEKAVRQMYDAYEQLNAARMDNAALSYMLAKAFEGQPEIGSRLQFLKNAIVGGIASTKPQILLDYAELLLRVHGWSNAVSLVQTYEQITVGNERSRSIQVAAYVGSGHFDEAADILDGMDPDDAQTKGMGLSLVNARIVRMLQLQMQSPLTSEQQKQLDEYGRQRTEAVDTLVDTHPEQITLSVVLSVCGDYLTENKPDRAKALMEKFLAHDGDNLTALIFQRSLLEPDPGNVGFDRLNDITVQVISEISDPKQRAVSLGRHYLTLGQYTHAADEYKKALNIAPDDEEAINRLFEIVISREETNLELAEQLAQKARQHNLDGCEGNFYRARISFARADYKPALERIEQCLKSRPVFSRAYYVRSRINNTMGNFDQAVEDAQTAVQMSPLDLLAAKQRVNVLHERNIRLNRKLSIEQQQETEQALRGAIVLNTNEWYLQSLYAQYRSSEHPEEALARFQFLQERAPSVTNHLLVADLATKMSRGETDEQNKQGLLEIAGSAYEKGYAMDPNNSHVEQRYSEFLRLTNRQDEAETFFAGKDNVLWRFYLRDGRYDKAAQILHKLHEQNPKEIDVIRGLALVARLTGDREGVRTYCEQLLDIENTIDNQILQIEMYLETGLIKEAELKVAGFREKHPQELRGLLLNGWVAMMRGHLEKALDLVNRNLELDSENAAAWRLRGKIYRLRGGSRQAIDDLQKSKRFHANTTVSLELALAYRQANRMAAAIGELKNALTDPMAPVHLRTTLERFYQESGRTNALITFYDDCIAKYPDTEAWYFRAAQFYLRQKDIKKAEELLQKAWLIAEKKEDPSPTIFDSYLQVLWLQEKYDNVLSLASKYIDTPDIASVAYAQMGQSQAKMGNKDLAVQYYHTAMEKCGNNDQLITGTMRNMTQAVGADEIDKWVASKLRASPDSLTANMAAFYLAQQSEQYNKALQHIEKCMAVITPSGSMYARYSALRAVTLVMAYMKTSDKQYLSQAIEQYEKILDDQPMNLQAINNLAFLLADNDEQLDKAEEYGARAHTGAPNNPNIMDTYAYTLCKNKKYTKAEELLRSTIQLYEVNGAAVPWEVFKHLGMAQEGLEQNELAAASYKQAKEIGGDTMTQKNKDQLDQAMKRVSQ